MNNNIPPMGSFPEQVPPTDEKTGLRFDILRQSKDYLKQLMTPRSTGPLDRAASTQVPYDRGEVWRRLSAESGEALASEAQAATLRALQNKWDALQSADQSNNSDTLWAAWVEKVASGQATPPLPPSPGEYGMRVAHRGHWVHGAHQGLARQAEPIAKAILERIQGLALTLTAPLEKEEEAERDRLVKKGGAWSAPLWLAQLWQTPEEVRRQLTRNGEFVNPLPPAAMLCNSVDL